MSNPDNITSLLVAWSQGDQSVKEKVFELIYPEMKKRAQYLLNSNPHNFTLQATALVHEAYLCIVDQRKANFQNKVHFLNIASHIMRRELVEYARYKKAIKRGGMNFKISISQVMEIPSDTMLHSVDIMALDEALKELAAFDERKSKLVELRYFAGLSVEDTAEVLGISVATYHREWEKARVFLLKELTKTI